MENKRALFALQAKDLSVGRRGQALLSGVNFTLQPGSSLAVIGESGCGKTTLLQTLAGVLPAVAGDVSCRSSESAAKPVNAIVWQNLALFPWLTVAGNLALPLKLKKEYGIAERVREMLAELELEGLERRFPAALSGGQRQRRALGRALIAKPDVLFMDAFHGRAVFGARRRLARTSSALPKAAARTSPLHDGLCDARHR